MNARDAELFSQQEWVQNFDKNNRAEGRGAERSRHHANGSLRLKNPARRLWNTRSRSSRRRRSRPRRPVLPLPVAPQQQQPPPQTFRSRSRRRRRWPVARHRRSVLCHPAPASWNRRLGVCNQRRHRALATLISHKSISLPILGMAGFQQVHRRAWWEGLAFDHRQGTVGARGGYTTSRVQQGYDTLRAGKGISASRCDKVSWLRSGWRIEAHGWTD